MSWSYSGDPNDCSKDLVRFLIGDTDLDDQQLSDEEINAMLTNNSSNAYMAAVACVRALIGRFTRYVTKSVGDLSISYGERLSNYQDLLAQLQQQSALSATSIAAPFCGGISVSDKETRAADSDRVAPAFTIGMHDYEDTDDSTGDSA